jgi:hypothetical protein
MRPVATVSNVVPVLPNLSAIINDGVVLSSAKASFFSVLTESR